MKGKTRRTGRADVGQVIKAVLTLFGTEENPASGESYAGLPYAIPGETQLQITDTMWGLGNALPRQDAFGEALRLLRETEKCMPGIPARENGSAFGEKRFSFACGTGDPCYLAVQCILTLMLRRNVKKFILLVRGTGERETISKALSAYVTQVSREMDFAAKSLLGEDGQNVAPDVTVYANGESDLSKEGRLLALRQLRRFICAPTPQILLMNREYFIRPTNLLLRPSPEFDGNIPMDFLTPGQPVLVTLSKTGSDVRRLIESAAVFNPLCTLSFTEEPDCSGTTVPVYVPGCRIQTDEDTAMEQLGFDTL